MHDGTIGNRCICFAHRACVNARPGRLALKRLTSFSEIGWGERSLRSIDSFVRAGLPFRRYHLLVEGYGLAAVMGAPGIDGTRTRSNHIIEVGHDTSKRNKIPLGSIYLDLV